MGIEEKNKEKISILLEDLTSLEGYARDLFTFLPLPVCLISPIGIVLEANPAFEKITNYKIEEIIGKPIENIFEKKEIKELTEEGLKKGSVRTREIHIFTKEGKKVLASASAILRKSEEGEAIGYFVGFFDLSPVKKGEEELGRAQTALLNILEDAETARKRAEEERDKTKAIVTHFADSLIVLDKENKIILINSEGEKLFDIKTEEVKGKTLNKITGKPFFKELAELIRNKKNKKDLFREGLSFKR